MSRFIDKHRGRLGVEPICRVLGVSASAYYQRAAGQRSERAVEDERLLARIRELHVANDYPYGYRRTWKALLRVGGTVPRRGMQRLMRTHGIVGASAAGGRGGPHAPILTRTGGPIWSQRDFKRHQAG